MKQITCALVIINENGDILGCHGYGKPALNGFDLPKGCHDENDNSHLATALRELKEETGIVLSDDEQAKIVDCGVYKHNSKKDIHLFLYKVDEFPDLSTLKCTSYFEDKNGKSVPEMSGYGIIKKEDREKYFYPVLQDKFPIIDSFNKTV